MSPEQAALAEIARIAAGVVQATPSRVGGDGQRGPDGRTGQVHGCRIMTLPGRLHDKAAQVAVRMNPANAPLRELPSDDSLVGPPLRLTLATSKYWGPSPRQFSVSFMENTPADLRARIVSHLNAWSATTGMSFAETSGTGEIRISRGPGGYYSYLGTDILLIPKDRQTMNLEGFTMNTDESEFHRVVRHEAGHTLGFPHEHMRRELVARIDPEKAYRYFLATQGWPREMVDQQVLTPLEDSAILGTPADQDSIMCYQLPGEITRDGLPIRGGLDINPSDAAFAATLYPKLSLAPVLSVPGAVEDWDPSQDVLVSM
ncbi:MAG TPA: M12 family metallopeptidase [Micromonospora sp.]